MMKKRAMIALLLCLLLPACTLAQEKLTLAQLKEETPAYLEISMTNKKGREVSFSAPILMPDAEAFPALRVVRNYSSDEALAPYRQWVQEEPQSTDTTLFVKAIDDSISHRADVTAIHHYLWQENPAVPAGEIYATPDTMSLEQAMEEMNGIIKALLGEEYELLADQVEVEGPYYKTHKSKGKTVKDGILDCGELTGKGGYWVDSILTYNGIPFFGGPFFRQGFGLRYREALLRNSLQAVNFWHYRPNDYILHMHAFKPIETIYEDVPLCSFETVKGTIENLIERDKLQDVFALYLGYIVWLDPEVDYPNSRKGEGRYQGLRMPYVATPVWLVEGIYASSTGRDYSEYPEAEGDGVYNYRSGWGHSCFMINAQTGKAYDPYDEGTKRMYAPDILTW